MRDSDTSETEYMDTLVVAVAQMRQMAPALRGEADQLPEQLLGSVDLSRQFRDVMHYFGSSVEDIAARVDGLAASYRQCLTQQHAPQPGEPGSILRRPLGAAQPSDTNSTGERQ